MKRVHVVGAAIEREGRILAARRSSDMSLAGKWEFAGGKVEAGETAEESLVRELREELGVDVEVGEFVARGVVSADGREIVLDVYRCTIVSGDPVALEHDALRWLPPDRLREVDWAEADLPAVEVLSRASRKPT